METMTWIMMLEMIFFPCSPIIRVIRDVSQKSLTYNAFLYIMFQLLFSVDNTWEFFKSEDTI